MTPDTDTGQGQERHVDVRVKWVVRGLAGIGAGKMLLTGVGYLLPETHSASRTLLLLQPANAVWTRLHDLISGADANLTTTLEGLADSFGEEAAWVQ